MAADVDVRGVVTDVAGEMVIRAVRFGAAAFERRGSIPLREITVNYRLRGSGDGGHHGAAVFVVGHQPRVGYAVGRGRVGQAADEALLVERNRLQCGTVFGVERDGIAGDETALLAGLSLEIGDNDAFEDLNESIAAAVDADAELGA